VILSGPSGSGKTTLHEKLLRTKRLKTRLVKTISATTRPRRTGERHGRDYLFLTPRQFAYRRRTGYFLEKQKVFGHWYGTPRHAVEKLLKAGKNVLLCIDVKGARVVRRAYPDVLGIFVKTPSLAVLKKRLRRRGTDTQATVARRLSIARTELRDARYYQYVVVNNTLTKALQRLESIVYRELVKGYR